MSAFNQAMLAKQLCRLITQSDSLISRIWKQQYFPSSKLYEVSCSSGLLLHWRSILATRDSIGAGSQWQIGSGRLVQVWRIDGFLDLFLSG
ncbi:UNVERIFIED_CONTAM: hypothetical protein Sangu_3166100, partial [Sesamum angustifolium]